MELAILPVENSVPVEKERHLTGGPVYRYGMLVFLLGLVGIRVWWHLTLSPSYPYDRYLGDFVPPALLFNHLAASFRWPGKVTWAFRIAGGSCIVAFFVYYFCYYQAP